MATPEDKARLLHRLTRDDPKRSVRVDEKGKGEVFRPSRKNVTAGVLCCVFIFAGAVPMTWYAMFPIHGRQPYLTFLATDDWSTSERFWAGLIGFGFLMASLWLAVWLLSLAGRSAEFTDEGLRIRRWGIAELVPWEEVARIRELIMHTRPPMPVKAPISYLAPKIPHASFTVHTRSGRRYAFDENTVEHLARFGDLLSQTARRLKIPWEKEDVHL